MLNIKICDIIENNLIGELQKIVTSVPMDIEQASELGRLINDIQIFCRGCLPVLKNQRLAYEGEDRLVEYETKYDLLMESYEEFNRNEIIIEGYLEYDKPILTGIINFVEI